MYHRAFQICLHFLSDNTFIRKLSSSMNAHRATKLIILFDYLPPLSKRISHWKSLLLFGSWMVQVTGSPSNHLFASTVTFLTLINGEVSSEKYIFPDSFFTLHATEAFSADWHLSPETTTCKTTLSLTNNSLSFGGFSSSEKLSTRSKKKQEPSSGLALDDLLKLKQFLRQKKKKVILFWFLLNISKTDFTWLFLQDKTSQSFPLWSIHLK